MANSILIKKCIIKQSPEFEIGELLGTSAILPIFELRGQTQTLFKTVSPLLALASMMPSSNTTRILSINVP